MKKILILTGLICSLTVSIAQTTTNCSADFDIIQQSSNVFLFKPKDTNNDNKHFWEFNDVNVNSTLSTPTYTFNDIGTYTITHYLICYNVSLSWYEIDTVKKTIVLPLNQPSLKIYPNPVNSISNIYLSLSKSNIIRLFVYDNNQNLVIQSQQLGNIGQNQIPINLSNKQSGIYYITIVYGVEIYKNKIIKL